MAKPDNERGLYEKYHVERLWSPGSTTNHDNCDYFVLDLVHDAHAKAALTAYADSCEGEFPNLAADLRARVADM